MKINDIKFLPKANALSDVYSKVAGMPIVGEMMAAAAGNGGEPNPFSNVVLNIREKVFEGGIYVLTFNSNYDGEISEMSVVLYGTNDFELEIGNFTPTESPKYTGTLFFDGDCDNIMELTNGGNYEIQITNTGETFSGKWTFNDATANCESTEFPTVEDIQIEQTEDGWVGRITFDRDIRTYVGFYFETINDTLNIGGFYLQSDLWEISEFEYLGNNTFQVSNITVDNPQSGEFDDFLISMNIGKFDECYSEVEGVSGTVTSDEECALTFWQKGGWEDNADCQNLTGMTYEECEECVCTTEDINNADYCAENWQDNYESECDCLQQNDFADCNGACDQ